MMIQLLFTNKPQLSFTNKPQPLFINKPQSLCITLLDVKSFTKMNYLTQLLALHCNLQYFFLREVIADAQ